MSEPDRRASEGDDRRRRADRRRSVTGVEDERRRGDRRRVPRRLIDVFRAFLGLPPLRD